MRKNKSKIDPMKGVVNADILKQELRNMVDGKPNARSYVRGALNYLERKPPNPFIVKVLKKALERK